jgi:hypothetical protein
LVGRGAWLGEMMDASRGKRPRIASNAQHAELRDALGKSRLVIATATLPAGLRKKIERQMQGDAEGENAMMQGVLGIGAAGVAIGTSGATTEIALELRCDNADACAQVEKLIAKKKSEWSANMGLRAFGFGALLDTLDVRVDSQKIHVSARLPTDDARRLIERGVEMRAGGRRAVESDAGTNPQSPFPRTDPSGEIISPRRSARTDAGTTAGAAGTSRRSGGDGDPQTQNHPQNTRKTELVDGGL